MVHPVHTKAMVHPVHTKAMVHPVHTKAMVHPVHTNAMVHPVHTKAMVRCETANDCRISGSNTTKISAPLKNQTWVLYKDHRYLKCLFLFLNVKRVT